MLVSAVLLLTLANAIAQEIGKPCKLDYSNIFGVCKLSTDCPIIKKQSSRGIRPTFCGFGVNSIPIVCCQAPVQVNDNSFLNGEFPTNTDTFIYPEDTVDDKNAGLPLSERKCREYNQLLSDEVSILPLYVGAEPTTFNVTTCDYNSLPLIVGGTPASLGEFPFMALIGFRNADNEIGWNCGGTLISDQFVMSAGHCANNREFPAAKVLLGELDIKRDDDGANPVQYDIIEIIKHPQYKKPNKYNDIVLFKLDRKVKFTRHIRPACLWRSPTIQEQQAIATGWGRTEHGGEPSSKLQKVALNVMPNSECDKIYKTQRGLPDGIVDTMLCAGELKGGKDTCQGDSGGPLFVSKNNQCEFHVIGITSFGRYCGAANILGVYTRVSSYIPWIEKTIW